jgi:hypothetical protein|tara:strand:+ start:260 stop:565 length:306 start_codon:yes stop_codon:yes gene_type:complete
MRHFILSNGTTVRSEKQAAAEFLSVHAAHAKISSDLDTLKSTIKENDAFAWFRHGIALTTPPTKSFDKTGAISLLRKLGATDKQIAKLTITGKTQRVSLAK